jgi:enterochelin esterase-like enzyme
MFAHQADGVVDEKPARSTNFSSKSTQVDSDVEKNWDNSSTACGQPVERRAPLSSRPPMSVRLSAGPRATEDAVELSLRDGRFRRVALVHELRRPRAIPFERRGGRWELRLPRPPADRFEYLLELEHVDGRTERVNDPGNPLGAVGPFGEKSVVEFPGYLAPAWLADDESQAGDLRELPFGLLWSAAETDPERPLPLLLVHDGPEYARYCELLRLFDHLVAFGELPAFRAALLPPPGDRNDSYSASRRYARRLAEQWLPTLARAAPFTPAPIGVGASLGALAFLHAHWTYPGLFGGLFLQSGSFFRRRFDAHEAGYGRFARIARFVGTVVGRRGAAEPVPTTITCGTAEENLDNNRVMAAALQERGFEARLVEHPDAHNWVSWRDALHPHLAELVLRVLS